MVDSAFADRLALAMRDRRITQNGLADALEVSQPSVSRWLAGTVPRKLIAVAIAEFLNVDLDWLREGKGESRYFSSLTTPLLQDSLIKPWDALNASFDNDFVKNFIEKSRLKFGVRIHLLRRNLGLSLHEFAAQCGLTPSYFSRVESGARPNPSWRTQDKITSAFPITRQWLLNGEPPILATGESLQNAAPSVVRALREMERQEAARREQYWKDQSEKLARDKTLTDEMLVGLIQHSKKLAVDNE